MNKNVFDLTLEDNESVVERLALARALFLYPPMEKVQSLERVRSMKYQPSSLRKTSSTIMNSLP